MIQGFRSLRSLHPCLKSFAPPGLILWLRANCYIITLIFYGYYTGVIVPVGWLSCIAHLSQMLAKRCLNVSLLGAARSNFYIEMKHLSYKSEGK